MFWYIHITRIKLIPVCFKTYNIIGGQTIQKPNFPSRLQGISLRAYEYQIQNIQLLQEEIDFFLYKCFVKIFKNCNLDVKKEFDRDGVDVEYTSGPVELV